MKDELINLFNEVFEAKYCTTNIWTVRKMKDKFVYQFNGLFKEK